MSLEKRVQLLSTSQCDFALQLDALKQYRKTITFDASADATTNVFYRAPTVDYMTTKAESVKLVVHPDNRWATDLFYHLTFRYLQLAAGSRWRRAAAARFHLRGHSNLRRDLDVRLA